MLCLAITYRQSALTIVGYLLWLLDPLQNVKLTWTYPRTFPKVTTNTLHYSLSGWWSLSQDSQLTRPSKIQDADAIFQDSDKLVIVRVVNEEDNYEAILNPANISYTITKLIWYFSHLFPNSKGGNLNPGIRIEFNSDR